MTIQTNPWEMLLREAATETGSAAPAEETTPAPAEEPSLIGAAGAGESADPDGSEESSEKEPDSSQEPAPEPLTADKITLPEGVEIDDETMNSFLETMNDAELAPAERAQRLVDIQLAQVQRLTEDLQTTMEKTWADTQKEWRDAAKALPEIGGENLDQNLAAIKKGLETVGATKQTFEALDATGAGNHPEIVKIFHALTKHLQEKQPVGGEPVRSAMPAEQVLYPSMNKG